MPSSKSARRFYRAAKQRFEDAEFLLSAERTTAAVYLAGYSIECMLKSLVLSVAPRSRQAEIARSFRGAKAHEYDWLLRLYSERSGPGLPIAIVPHFARVTAWSTDMRYLPGTLEFREATAFLQSAVEIMSWADGRM